MYSLSEPSNDLARDETTSSRRIKENQPTRTTNKYNLARIINCEETNGSSTYTCQQKNTRDEGKRRTRRGRKQKKVTNRIKIWYTNINGIISKKDDLINILKIDQPHIVSLTETKTAQYPIIPGYRWIAKAKPNNAGGVAIAAREDIANQCEEIEEEKYDKMEIIWIKIKTGKGKLSIGTYYGKQESENRVQVDNEYSLINSQAIRLMKDGDLILLGDFNAKLEIKRNNNVIQKQSGNGKLLQRIINNTRIYPINIKADKGIWTRVNRHNTQEKSVIDYALASPNIIPDVKKIEIDEEGLRRPKGKNETDHNTILIEIDTKTRKSRKSITKWNISDETKWNMYNEALKAEPEVTTYEEWETRVKEALLKTVGTKTILIDKKPPLSKENRILRKRMKEAKKIFEDACRRNSQDKRTTYTQLVKLNIELKTALEKDQKERVKKITDKLIADGGVKSKYFWNLRNKLTNKQKSEYDHITEDDIKIVDPTEAKESIANYYEKLYKAREGKEEYKSQTEEIEKKYENISQQMEQIPKCNPINYNELKLAIKKLKNGKAPGPDNIPNEALKNMDKINCEKTTSIMNQILIDEKIPSSWLNSKIIRIYKGKGTKGKCSSERGITLSSNVGKTFERIINHRLENIVNVTDEQAGGRKGKSTVDHIAALQTIIEWNKQEKKPTYITFLDVTKAYDKAWIKAIMYVLEKVGLKDRLWRIVDYLNKNLNANIETKYGLTRQIYITDSIRQGGVLSVIQYATLMDEISKETRKTNIGKPTQKQNETLNTLLWMDDVALITNNLDDMQKLLNITNDIANKYHIAFGKEKSKIMKIGREKKHKNVPQKEPILGNMKIEYTNKYKYLGFTMNSSNNLQDHIKNIQSKTEGAYQTIISLLHNKEFSKIEMASVWKLVETCIIPIITYSSEVWTPTKRETEILNRILDNIIKRILMTPQSTPREVLYIETNLMDIETIIDKRKINMFYRTNHTKNKITEMLHQTNKKTKWMEDMENVIKKYKINKINLLRMKPGKAKNYIRKSVHKVFRNKLFANINGKNKVEHTINRYIGQEKSNYTNVLDRRTTSILFKARTRMLDVKANYKNKYKDQICRLCKKENETQIHVLTQCEVTKEKKLTIDYDMLSAYSNIIAKSVAENIQKITELLNNN